MGSPSVVNRQNRPDDDAEGSARVRGLGARVAAAGAMLLGLLVLYCPPGLFGGGRSLVGLDYPQIHEHRIRYAQEALFSNGGHLPAWHTRELMGSPFWSNIQSFPFVPARLAVFWIDPEILFPVAVNLSAILAALFTYLYLRKLGLGRVGSAAGGWTFAASGYFASRILAGHLPLLEAFCALPLLLWCLECIAQSPRVPRGALDLGSAHVGLAFAVLCVVLCGHPQIPAYAVGTAVVYALVRLRGRSALRALLAMGIGVGLSGFVWWPMLRLIGRSTRILPLDPPGNDLALPYWRLKAFLFPWADGWPRQVMRLPAQSFVDSNAAYFWDTVCYVGWIPVLAALFLLGRAIVRGRWPARPWVVIAVVATGAVVLALPFAQALTSQFRVTLLRSPSRMLYLTTFALAAAIAVLVDLLLKAKWGSGRTLCAALTAVLLGAHAVDLGAHAKSFISLRPRLPPSGPDFERWRKNVGEHRFAFDMDVHAPGNRAVDDAGFFDSIMLARPYRAILALSGLPPQTNTQSFDASILPPPALAGLCVQTVITDRKRGDLELRGEQGGAIAYGVPDPLPRSTFLPDPAVLFLDDWRVLDFFSKRQIDFGGRMHLDPASRPADFRPELPAPPEQPPPVYRRPDSDQIVVRVDARSPGFVRVMESWDDGWSATIDGASTRVLVADTFAMAVRVPEGAHEVRLVYRTPGARTGLAISAASVALLALLTLGFRAVR